MYSNLYKRGIALVKEDTRIIDSNTLAAEKISKNIVSRISPLPADEDGFSQGLAADVIDVLTGDVDEAGAPKEPEMTGPSVEELKEQALLEIEQLKSEAMEALAAERQSVLEAAKKQGYEEGYAQGMRETDIKKQQLEEQRKNLEKQYEEQLQVLEPQFIDCITAVYEHVFGVELSGQKNIIVYLISSAIRNIEGGRNLIVHVSKEDYAYVSMQKKKLEEGMPTGTLELVEDVTLSKNEALIETEGGIFDCSLGTQLAELTKKLKLLSFQKPVEE